ncbi:hypothetical protein PsYK624_048600 [Phanerochaete sordida]|uniref:Amine oxidase domain-containing protein n=1 Tax=Phanerochaete sordida TaxID=48140 RepID=A0A9P3G7B3_9APHY|nr:hypothetical protein PsYK624_048600 [Phanerochaete sordida]
MMRPSSDGARGPEDVSASLQPSRASAVPSVFFLSMKVAVVGSGVSGLAATWLLNEYSDHEVHLYEASARAGGHANTVAFKQPGVKDAAAVDVDT